MSDFARYAARVSTEVCGYCGKTIVADDEQELYIDRRDAAECSAAPRYQVDRDVWISGLHEPA